jgi:hypothetical protein
MMRFVTAVLLFHFFLLGLCESSSAWLAEASAGQQHESVWNSEFYFLSPDEKKWFNTFLQGNFLTIGWSEITDEVLSHLPESQREEQRISMKVLGEKIGVEWAKKNKARKINTSMLIKWGDRLKSACKNPVRIPQTITELHAEVNSILK